jgi:hypothetical protein
LKCPDQATAIAPGDVQDHTLSLLGVDEDWLIFDAVAHHVMQVRITGTDNTIKLELFELDETPITEEPVRTRRELFRAARPILVRVTGLNVNAYQIDLQDFGPDDHGDTADTATVADGLIDIAGTIDIADDVDVFSFLGGAGQRASVVVATDNPSRTLSILDVDGVTVLAQQAGAGSARTCRRRGVTSRASRRPTPASPTFSTSAPSIPEATQARHQRWRLGRRHRSFSFPLLSLLLRELPCITCAPDPC